VGCQSTGQGATQSLEQGVSSSSSLTVAKSAADFNDQDIEVPAYFNTQGLQFCEFSAVETDSRCPLAKKTIRVHFNNIETHTDADIKANSNQLFEQVQQSVGAFESQALINSLENQFAGVNRFRLITGDNATLNQSLDKILAEEGAQSVAQRSANSATVSTDYIMSVDVLKSADMMFGAKQSMFNANLQMSTGFINPYTRERVSYPNIGQVAVANTDVRDPQEFATIIVNDQYYRGFNYSNPVDVSAMFAAMASSGFNVMLSRLLTEMPATAQVAGIRGDRISLDRGQNAGVLPNETMVIFEYSAGFVDPIGVAIVTPSMNSAQGQIVRWKNSNIAKQVQRSAASSTYQPAADKQLFAVSVGVPQSFLQERTTWSN
jgi:hypothetical protein